MGLSYLLDAFIFLGFSPFAPNYMFHDVFKLSVSIVIWNYWVCSSERRPQRVEQFFLIRPFQGRSATFYLSVLKICY